MFLNDIAASLYTNAALTPHVIAANEELETELLTYGVEVQRVVSAAIPVAIGAVVLLLPTDFLLPIALYERDSGATTAPYVEIKERMWNPTDYTQVNTLNFWAFYNNNVNFPGATTARDVLMQYERQLAVVTGPNSPEDFVLSKRFLAAKTGELAARYIGMNPTFADDIARREVEPARDKLIHILVGNMQGNPQRRQRFTTQRRRLG